MILRIIIALISLILLSSCSSQEVASGRLIQKRKHRPGFHVNFSTPNGRPANDELKAEVTLTMMYCPKIQLMNPSGGDEYPETNLQETDFPQFLTHKNLDRFEQGKRKLFKVLDSFDPIYPPEQKLIADEPDEEEPKEVAANLTGIIALIFGILSLLGFMYLPFLGVLFSILTMVFAYKALKIENKSSKSFGTAAAILGVVSFCVSLFITLLVSLGLGLFFVF